MLCRRLICQSFLSSRVPHSFRKIIHALFPGSQCLLAHSVQEAQQYLQQQEFELCVIQPPLPDEFGVRCARQFAISHSEMGILLLIQKEILDQTIYEVHEEGIFVLGVPVAQNIIYQALMCLLANTYRYQKMAVQIRKANARLREGKLIFRAKLLLIEQRQWSEEKAHHYIERLSMEAGQKKITIAEMILAQKQ